MYESSILISASDANKLIVSTKDIVILDIRPNKQYLEDHLPKAFNIWRPDMEHHDGGPITGMRATREEMEDLLDSFCITPSTIILLYGNNLDEYRMWWLLDMYGHKQNIRIIDGGLKSWIDSGFTVNKEQNLVNILKPIKKQYFFKSNTDMSTLASFEDIVHHLSKENSIILDTRSMPEHRGEEIKLGAYCAGRIMSPHYIHYQDNFDDSNLMKSRHELCRLYENILSQQGKIIVYCQSGVRSAVTLFVLKELLGYKDVSNYDGSWIEWSYYLLHSKK